MNLGDTVQTLGATGLVATPGVVTQYNAAYQMCGAGAAGNYDGVFEESDCGDGGNGVYTEELGPKDSNGDVLSNDEVFTLTFDDVPVTTSIEIRYYAPGWTNGGPMNMWINGVRRTDLSATTSGNYQNLIISASEVNTLSRIGVNGQSGNAYVGIFWVKVDGELVGDARATENINVISIDETNPIMTVDGGGTWNLGQTVKNSVARSPEITPTTDEITEAGTTSDVPADTWSNYLFTSASDTYEPESTSTDFYAGRTAVDSFDGDTSSWCGGANVGGSWLYWRPPVPIDVNKLRIYTDDTPGAIRFNGENTDYSWTNGSEFRLCLLANC